MFGTHNENNVCMCISLKLTSLIINNWNNWIDYSKTNIIIKLNNFLDINKIYN